MNKSATKIYIFFDICKFSHQLFAFFNIFLYLCRRKEKSNGKKAIMEMQADSTLMSKEEYFRRLDEAEKGSKFKMLPNESLDDMLTRLSYINE